MSVADRVRLRRTALRLTAVDAADARRQAVAAIGGEPVREIRLEVHRCSAPRGWIGEPRLRGVSTLSIERSDTGALVRIVTRTAMDPGVMIAAAVRCVEASAPEVGPLLTMTAGNAPEASLLVPGLRDILDDSEPNPHLRRCDTLVAPSAAVAGETGRSRTVVIDRSGWSIDGTHRDVVVDPLVHRPLGRSSIVDGEIGTAFVADGRLVVQASSLRIETDRALTAEQVELLRSVRGLATAEPLPLPWRAQLEACGLVMSVDDFPETNLEWQTASVHVRRHALRWYTPAAALDAWPSVSVVLVTHRTDFLEHAIDQLAKLSYPRLQVVIGLHGLHLDDAAFNRLRGFHDVVIHRMDRGLAFGEAVQSTCDRADGSLITKVDDDDYYGSEHVWDLVLARMTSGATLVGKALDWIYVESENVTAFRPTYAAETYATFVAGGTLLISKADLADVGGWRPVPKSVDRALIESVKRDGGLVYRTHGLGYVYVRHAGGHTATVNDHHFLTKNVEQRQGLMQHEALGTVRHG